MDDDSHSSAQFESVLCRVREQLNADKVKLWLPPFTAENGEAGEYPQDLVLKYSSELQIPAGVVSEALESLRRHSLEKLVAQKSFKESGMATIKIRLAGDLPANSTRKLQMTSLLQTLGRDFKDRLCSEVGKDPARLKLISSGRVIEDDKLLDAQHVKNNSTMMAILLPEAERDIETSNPVEEGARANITRTKQAAEALSKRTDGGSSGTDQYFVEINDQEGRPLSLPESERKALVVAMTLHERGRSILNQKKHAEALVVLLEADKEFSLCRAQILEAVDNYAILCLDIVWCYLWLNSISHLPSAEEKLAKCKECFERSYGKNLERLEAVRGGSGRELVLFVRLHILEAAIAYHRGRLGRAAELVHQAEEEMKKLHVDSDKFTQVVSMGFSAAEARLSLRACAGDVTLAVEHITRKRQEKEERKRKEREKREREKLERKLGKTKNGEWVNVGHYRALVNMGFTEQLATRALREANNNLDGALQIIQDRPEVLFADDASVSQSAAQPQFPDEVVAQVFALGFDLAECHRALTKFNGDVRRAIDFLTESGGVFPPLLSSPEDREEPEVEAAVRELVPTLAQHEDEAHLNLSLEEEASVIAEYKALLLSTGRYNPHLRPS